MNPRRDDQLREQWMTACHHAAPLGRLAVQEAVTEIAGYHDVEVASVVVRPHDTEPHRLVVSISYRDKEEGKADPNKTLVTAEFSVRNPNVRFAKWEDNLSWMQGRQAMMPPHLRGLEINVTQEEYDQALATLRTDTGYDGLTYGDVWVHKVVGGEVQVLGPFSPPPHAAPVAARPGTLCWGALTRAGEIALRKYEKVHNLRPEAA